MRVLIAIWLAIVAAAALAQSLPSPGPGVGPFVPPCTPNTQGGGTFANTISLHHFDNNGTDSSGHGHTGTITGTGAYSTVQKKFGTHSYKQAAGGNSFTMNAFPSNSGDFTFEMWAWDDVAPGAFTLVSDSASSVWLMRYNASGPQIDGQLTNNLGGSGVLTSDVTPPFDSAWHSYAWVRASGVSSFYLDGVKRAMTGTDVSGTVLFSANVLVYSNFGPGGTGGYAFNGYIDEARYSNVARYTATYTPAIQPFCNF
jgi:hypothetical protein